MAIAGTTAPAPGPAAQDAAAPNAATSDTAAQDAAAQDAVAQDAAAAPPSSLVGKRVELHQLTSRADLNGRLGFACAYDSGVGRYAVRLDGDGGAFIKVQPRNLKEVTANDDVQVYDALFYVAGAETSDVFD